MKLNMDELILYSTFDKRSEVENQKLDIALKMGEVQLKTAESVGRVQVKSAEATAEFELEMLKNISNKEVMSLRQLEAKIKSLASIKANLVSAGVPTDDIDTAIGLLALKAIEGV